MGFLNETTDVEHASRQVRLGEPGTEQFEIETRVNDVRVHKMKMHDPFVRTTTTLHGIGCAWRCLFGGLRVTTFVHGSHGAMRDVMNLDPTAMASPVHDTNQSATLSSENQNSPPLRSEDTKPKEDKNEKD